MNRREVSTRFTPAVAQAERTLRGPALKFSITGTRPMASRAKKVATAPRLVGSSTPTCSPGAVTFDSRRPRAKAARIRSVYDRIRRS